MNEYYASILKKVLKILILVLLTTAGIFLCIKASRYLAPFIVAFALSALMQPLIRLLVNKLKVPRKAAALISLLLVVSILGSIVTLIIMKLISEIQNIYTMLPVYFSSAYDDINRLFQKATEIYIGLPEEVSGNLSSLLSDVSNSALSLMNTFLKGILNTAVSIPEAFIFILVTILSTYFFTSDWHLIYGFFKTQLPEAWVTNMQNIKNNMFSALFGYIRAQLILMTITFLELNIGFVLAGVKHPIIAAAIISLIDALPILGSGSILIPWAAYAFLMGNIGLGISMLVIYLVVVIIRQLMEPKVLGQQIGLHPLITLVAMYSGLQLFGFAGLIIGPVSFLLAKNVASGLLKGKTLKEYISERRTA